MLLDFFSRLFRQRHPAEGSAPSTTCSGGQDESEEVDTQNPFPDIVVIEFKDVIDLHSIPARQIRAVVEDYLEEARRRKTRWVRIIHGKGIGVQREIVRSVLARTPFVAEFRDAPLEAGGWGATVVTLNVEDG
jgi:dsDNA-specific endonuclease/ATPase MutS2